MSISVKINTPDFARQLNQIKAELQTKVVRQSMGAGAAIFRKAAEAEAPKAKSAHRGAKRIIVIPGNLRRSVYSFRMRSRVGEVEYRISVRKGRRSKVSKKGGLLDAYYWPWVHEGHLVRAPGEKIRGGVRRATLERNRLKSGGAKMVPPNRFLTRAFERNQKKAIDATYARMEKLVARLNAIT